MIEKIIIIIMIIIMIIRIAIGIPYSGRRNNRMIIILQYDLIPTLFLPLLFTLKTKKTAFELTGQLSLTATETTLYSTPCP